MKKFLLLFFCSSLLFPQTREIVITIDDLPVVSSIRDTNVYLDITKKLVGGLLKNKVPAVGFIMKEKVFKENTIDNFQIRLLKIWDEAGLELGNHTYSHFSLHKVDTIEYMKDIIREDSLINNSLSHRMKFFRHPYLHTGRTKEIKGNISNFLNEHEYTVAPVSIDNADYVYARAYDAVCRKGDDARKKQLSEEYINYMDSVLAYYEKQSESLLGYEIKQILLMHANRLNADNFDQLAEMIRQRGYKFISLEEALKDKAYLLPDEFYGMGGISWLHRWAVAQKKTKHFFAGEPEVPQKIYDEAGLKNE